MKNLIVAGVAKSGKSTLCEMICQKHRINHIPIDYFTAAMKRNFPEWGIKSDVIINETSKKLCALLETITDIIDDKTELFIIDSAHIMPEDIINKVDINNWDIIFVGYPNIDIDTKFKNIKDNEKNGWTVKKSDEELKYLITELIEISKKIEFQCQKYNIKFIDTSCNFMEVLENEADKI